MLGSPTKGKNVASSDYVKHTNVDVIMNMAGVHEIKKKNSYEYYQGSGKWTNDRSKAKTWRKRQQADRVAKKL